MRKRNGWFWVSLVDHSEFLVKEADLFNTKKYYVKQKKMYVSAQDCEASNRRIKRDSKRLEEENMWLAPPI